MKWSFSKFYFDLIVGNNFILKMMREAATKSKGLPLCVQVVAKPYQEEVCLGVMKIVEDAWRKSK